MIKFIDYNGKWPCLCYGTLILEVNGKTYVFYDEKYAQFWESGGNYYRTNSENEVITKNPWIIKKNLLPEELREYSQEIEDIFNKNVPFGCCGGCI